MTEASPESNPPNTSRGGSAESSVVAEGGENGRPTAFPVAGIREARAVTSALLLRSKMWWATVICLVLAFWLTWQSIPSHGPTITIRFPDGHGLKSGDTVRHRGIEAGVVESVALSDDLSQITATVTLTPGAAGLAREGTRFWIVRPQLSLAGVSGLETAVGAKYIGVSPGDPNGPRVGNFEGLSAAPPDVDGGDGLDIVLRSDAKHGVSVGSPVTWRGVEVGQILSLNLSPDARFVDVHARINSEYTRLLQTTSQFWVNSGFGIDVGLSGIRMNADSLSSIVRGGVSFATPVVSSDKSPVTSGFMFVLHDKPAPGWLSSASSIPLIDFPIPPTVTITGTRKTSLLGITRNQKFIVNGVLVSGRGDTTQILTAADLLPLTAGNPDNEQTQSAPLAEFVVGSALTRETTTITSSSTRTTADDESGFIWLPCSDPPEDFAGVRTELIRVPEEPEDCCLCRLVRTDNDVSSVIQSISRDQLRLKDKFWIVTMDVGDLSPWHGAPVISMQDGKIIGVFITGKSGAAIAPLRL